MKKRIFAVCLALCMLLLLCPSCGNDSAVAEVEIVFRDFGTVRLHIAGDKAPETAKNFLKLVDEGFYDGLTLHRIISGFMIQGGDPDHNGMGGSSGTVKGEFISNGFSNPISHVRGVISMARTSDPDSASSQFFICHEDSTFLDGNYAAFGWVTSGLEVVDAICDYVTENSKTAGFFADKNNGMISYQYQPVITSVRRVG